MLDFKLYILVLCVVLPIVVVALIIVVPKYIGNIFFTKTNDTKSKVHKSVRRRERDDENL